jgi:hypothetical protein
MVQAIKAGAGAQPVWINSDSTSDLVAPVDGFMIENMGASWGTSFMSQAEVEQRLRDVDTNVAAGKDALLVGQGNQSDVERMRFSHAIYLLVAGPHVSYRFQNAGDYRSFWDYPEYRLDLGDPSGPRYPVGGSVWRRDFSAGTAIVNLSNTASQTVDLGSTYTLPGGGIATSVTLAPDHGMALSLAGSPPPPPPVAVPGSVPNVRVSAATGTSVTVAWDAASGTVGGYRLSRGGTVDGTTSALQWQFSGLSCGTSYSFAVQAYNASGSGSTSTISAASAPCASGSPTNTALPTVRGQDTVGTKLRGSRGTWSGHPSSYDYQWLRCDTVGANCAAIAGATAQNYVQRSVDQGLTVRLQVTATNGGGSAKALSHQTSVIA